ncbi:putative Rtr1 RPAP2 family [Trypanosoma vivax]|uniref:RTR1-type domain-containing protein n=1 Tax=Trypanosoma vivax (strain Y486) TaxID=1055687 RepID=G0U5L4_TRYVY|nr:putative Rtr1 RPAP2 family [Trypanosoma vivax]CCC51165.1 conserved hypothetical protein [Trypanosoma vivax Y486]
MAGGSWEVVVDTAAMEVTKYLIFTTSSFQPTSRTAEWMMTLLDDSTLRNIVVERNLCCLCGMVGCAKPPQATTSRLSLTSATRKHGSVEDCDMGGDTPNDGSEDTGDGYAEDAEVFRQYARYREKSSGCTTAASAAASVSSKMPMTSATMTHCFCSLSCAKSLECLRVSIPSTLVYGRENLLQALCGLFPNMQLAVLQRLAGAESTAVDDVRERELPTLQTSDSPAAVGSDEEAISGWQDLLKGMEGAQSVWNRMVLEAGRVRREMGSQSRMPMPLMVYDWLLTISTEQTKRTFARLCYSHMREVGEFVQSENKSSSASEGLYAMCMLPVLKSCLKRGKELAALQEADDAMDEQLSVDPSLQQERLALFEGCIFSRDVCVTLSKLLLYDQSTLERAWAVWHTSGLLHSLQFPFAVPGAFISGTTSPARLFLAIVATAAIALCVPQAWAEWLQEDNGLLDVISALGVTPNDLIVCVRALAVE